MLEGLARFQGRALRRKTHRQQEPCGDSHPNDLDPSRSGERPRALGSYVGAAPEIYKTVLFHRERAGLGSGTRYIVRLRQGVPFLHG